MKNQLFKISPDLKITLEILNQFGPKTPQTETTKTLTTKEKLELKRKQHAEEEKLLEELLHKEEIEEFTLKLKKEAQENLTKETQEHHNKIENDSTISFK